LKSFVSCIRSYADATSADYFLVSEEDEGSKTRSVKSKLLLNIGEAVEVSVSNGTVESALSFDEGGYIETIRKKMERTARKILKGKRYSTGINEVDEITGKAWNVLSEGMLLLLNRLVSASPIIIRFHNDVDGVSGAYALYKAITRTTKANKEIGYTPNIIWRMHGGVSYSREDATSDIMACNNFECTEKPMLIILDFGTSEESNPGIELVKERFEIVWLDHHPVVEKFDGRKLKYYINPWNFGGDSNYTAGFLACVFARTLCEIDTRELEGASFIGDYSEYMHPTQESRRLAVLLDLLSSDTKMIAGSRGNLTPETIDEVLNDEKRSNELVSYAENRVSEMLDTAIKSVKEYKAKGMSLYVADFEDIRGDEEQKYPLPGRFASKLLDRIEELNKEPCLLLLHFGYFISARMSKQLTKRINLLKILDEVKEERKDLIESTGGHSNAASIKLKSESAKKEVINATVERIKEETGSGEK
jgi:RecJ-like exonuclease